MLGKINRRLIHTVADPSKQRATRETPKTINNDSACVVLTA